MVFNMCPALFHAENPSRNKAMSHKHWTTTISTEPTINTALVLSCSTHDFAFFIHKNLGKFDLFWLLPTPNFDLPWKTCPFSVELVSNYPTLSPLVAALLIIILAIRRTRNPLPFPPPLPRRSCCANHKTCEGKDGDTAETVIKIQPLFCL